MSIKDLIRFSEYKHKSQGISYITGVLSIESTKEVSYTFDGDVDNAKEAIIEQIIGVIYHPFYRSLFKLHIVLAEAGLLKKGSKISSVLQELNSIANFNPSKEGWQPIETAPKNSKGILVYSQTKEGHFKQIDIATFNHKVSCWVDNRRCCIDKTTTFSRPESFVTHWMPLPEPPEVTG